jgi:hypothetical protein
MWDWSWSLIGEQEIEAHALISSNALLLLHALLLLLDISFLLSCSNRLLHCCIAACYFYCFSFGIYALSCVVLLLGGL